MTARRPRDPSPTRSALIHGSLGAVTLFGSLGLAGSLIQISGDEAAGSPVVRMALFDAEESPAPTQFAARLETFEPRLPTSEAAKTSLRLSQSDALLEPTLGVEYNRPAAAPEPARVQKVASTQAPTGVTINGKVVPFGKSFSEVENAAAVTVSVNSLQVEPRAASVEMLESGPYRKNARTFENAAGKPTISIIVGGLGTNFGRTKAAIDDLPPEITLSFAPTALNLSSWVNRARRAGHEVLIELPMEPYDYGRLQPHPQILQTGFSSDTNIGRLGKLLARTNGYMGVMNYQGAKFATELDDVTPIMAELKKRGVAFFENGHLAKSEFGQAAHAQNLAFGEATTSIDARMDADEISKELMLLEVTARENGKALGTGLSFPLTLDLLKEWLPTLEEKGIVLAPASYYAASTVGQSSNVELAALDTQG